MTAAEPDSGGCTGAVPPAGQPALRMVPMPADVNINGDVFGGWIMAQADVAGGITARRIAGGRLATVAVTNFLFRQPVSVGDVVSFYARIIKVGTSSITVDVEVFAERHEGERFVHVRVTEAQLVYVAIDSEGRKRPLPPEAADAALSPAASGVPASA
ncbi:MAG TPA: acyl-CoA thioesterase [Spirochaetales bacterium]|nr:acyl-CoA thioesterase [Spirochaetales bacterium]